MKKIDWVRKLTSRKLWTAVGMKMIVVKAELFCDTNYGYDGSEKDYIGRDVKEQMKVAIVAYGCNKTRLVPMDSFEIIKEEDKC